MDKQVIQEFINIAAKVMDHALTMEMATGYKKDKFNYLEFINVKVKLERGLKDV